MFLTSLISAISGLLVGSVGCYVWREAATRKQLQQVLAVMEDVVDREDISLPIVSQLRRRAIANQRQQQRLQQQLFSWQSVLQDAPIGYLQLDADNQVLWCNQTAQNLLQIHKWHAGTARLLLELVRSYELDGLISKVRSTLIGQDLLWQFHFGYKDAANSQSIWLKASGIPLANGEIGIFVESQQERVDTATARERWLGDLAHEIRTPLTAIHLLAETLESKVPPELTRWPSRILTQTNRLIDLVQHFVELSQLESTSSQSLRLVATDVVKTIDDAWHTLEPIAIQRQIKFVRAGLTQSLLEIDAARFTQVWINLFDNSLKYCPDLGHIWIDIQLRSPEQIGEGASSSNQQSVVIDLYDDGTGFAPDDLPHIFDRLYRGDVSRYRPAKGNSTLDSQTTGSGLGLAIVRQIILAHHGTIVANNHPTTHGAWFRIILPHN
ncbi:HAMP domain-containing sensor histidine kinase [Chamaesiphon sp. VAR_69_metabat_338]|uniref:sensor histidine kinase n=1 Tax=Chamaesiphon sp. VAR_69_metabat_338 TaxID=2964704 RepID=UPI00286E2E18|nr:HAMP domain-containing sensor histidine kinase [Chamaesiphon sp. VAR_69_metabat_338]